MNHMSQHKYKELKGDNLVLNQIKGHNKIHLQNLQKFHTKGATHQMTFKLMKMIVSCNLKGFSNQSTPCLTCKSNMELNATYE